MNIQHLVENQPDEPFTIDTQRLTLRAPSMQDTNVIAELLNNPKIAIMTSRIPHPYQVQDAESYIKRSQHLDETSSHFLIHSKVENQIIGGCSFEQHESLGAVEIGYWIGEPFWGKNYASEATKALIDYLFSTLGVKRIVAMCRDNNLASRRVIEKSGFTYQAGGMTFSSSLSRAIPVEIFYLKNED